MLPEESYTGPTAAEVFGVDLAQFDEEEKAAVESRPEEEELSSVAVSSTSTSSSFPLRRLLDESITENKVPIEAK
jgi:hypothetical protein